MTEYNDSATKTAMMEKLYDKLEGIVQATEHNPEDVLKQTQDGVLLTFESKQTLLFVWTGEYIEVLSDSQELRRKLDTFEELKALCYHFGNNHKACRLCSHLYYDNEIRQRRQTECDDHNTCDKNRHGECLYCYELGDRDRYDAQCSVCHNFVKARHMEKLSLPVIGFEYPDIIRWVCGECQ